jgi:hypothetical protein
LTGVVASAAAGAAKMAAADIRTSNRQISIIYSIMPSCANLRE